MDELNESTMNHSEESLSGDPTEVEVAGQRYEVVGTIGEGAMGRVFEVASPLDSDHLALKESHLPTDPVERARQLEMLRTEATLLRVLQELDHPALPSFVSADLASEPPKFLFELIPGHTLDERIDAGQPFTTEQVDELLASVGNLVATMHRLPVALTETLAAELATSEPVRALVHLDLKPANIIVSGERVVLIDHGTAIAGAFSRFTHPVYELGAEPVYGTPPYVDPIYAWSRQPLPSADVYSLAATILALTLPGGIPDTVTQQITSYLLDPSSYDRRTPWPLTPLVDQTSLPGPYQQLLRDCLSLNLKDRPEDVRGMLSRLPREQTEFYAVHADGYIELDLPFAASFPPQAQRVLEHLIEATDPRLHNLASPDELSRQLQLLVEALPSRDDRSRLSPLFGVLLGRLIPRPSGEPHALLVALRQQHELVVRAQDIIHAIARSSDPQTLSGELSLTDLSGSSEFWEALKTRLDSFDRYPFVPVTRVAEQRYYKLPTKDDGEYAHLLPDHLFLSEAGLLATGGSVIPEHLELEDLEIVEPGDFITEDRHDPNAPVMANPGGAQLFEVADHLHSLTRDIFMRALLEHRSFAAAPAVLAWLERDFATTRTQVFSSEVHRRRLREAVQAVKNTIAMVALNSCSQLNSREVTLTDQELTGIFTHLPQLIDDAFAADREFSGIEGEAKPFEHYFAKSIFVKYHLTDRKLRQRFPRFRSAVDQLCRVLLEREALRQRPDLFASYIDTRLEELPEYELGARLKDPLVVAELTQTLRTFGHATLTPAVQRSLQRFRPMLDEATTTIRNHHGGAVANTFIQAVHELLGTS